MSTDVKAEAILNIRKEITRLQETLQHDKTRQRSIIIKRIHELRLMIDRNYRYSSQSGQDAVVDGIFHRKRGGTFLDIGGYDGLTGSNTFFLEVFRGWNGTLVEPVPTQLEKARQIRKCQCLGYAIATSTGKAEFMEIQDGYTQMSGLVETYAEGSLKAIRRNQNHRERVIEVPTRTLADLIDETGIACPDFISLDIEGGEIAVLETFDFKNYPVPVWAIENNSAGTQIPEIMRSNGYNLVEFCGVDEIYRLSDSISPA